MSTVEHVFMPHQYDDGVFYVQITILYYKQGWTCCRPLYTFQEHLHTW